MSLQLWPQWAVCAPGDKSPRNLKGERIGVHDYNQLVSYDEILQFLQRNPQWGYGFVLNAKDPFTCIDLDYKDDLNERDKKFRERLFNSIVQTMDSYTEISQSGKGVHIWVKGNIGVGRRRDGVEVYSQGRFIICTGKVYINKEIENRQDVLNNMISQMEPEVISSDLIELDEKFTDEEIVAKLVAEGEKYTELFNGRWQGQLDGNGRHYPSQSEADHALIEKLCFYSKSNEQVRRIFRYSGLGQREKAWRDSYINKSIALQRSKESTAEELKIAAEISSQLVATKLKQVSIDELKEIDWPPGFAGTVAKHFYENSIHPVKEISIISVLGLLSGVCGKGWNISNTGLNNYYVLIAPSGTGKEAMYTNINSLLNDMKLAGKMYMHNFVNSHDYVSASALMKGVSANNCFINLCPEIGKRIQLMATNSFNPSNHLNQLRTLLTRLYSKSGHTDVTGGLIYSDAEKTVLNNFSSSYSLLGESTPDVFYESLTDDMMEDGFISRFVIIEYTGKRPDENEKEKVSTPKAIIETFDQISLHACNLIQRRIVQNVKADEASSITLKTFGKLCSDKINENTDEGIKQIWNRAHLKVLKISALLAIADNYLNPVIDIGHTQWSINLIKNNIDLFLKRKEEGKVGTIGDRTREKQVIKDIEMFLSGSREWAIKMHPRHYITEGLITRSYLSRTSEKTTCFKNHKLGSKKALDDAIDSLIKNGSLIEVPITDIAARKGDNGIPFTGKLYRYIKQG